MADKPGYRVTIEAFVPCNVGDEEGKRLVTSWAEKQPAHWRNAGATITRFAIEMVDGGRLTCKHTYGDFDEQGNQRCGECGEIVNWKTDIVGERLTQNPNLDAAAAMGGMGEAKPDIAQWVSTLPGNTCPVCHTPGGEHVPECKMCKCMWGVVEAAPWCPDCFGAGRVLVEDKEKDDE